MFHQKVYINNIELDEPYLGEGTFSLPGNIHDIVVPDNHVFVLGDNRSDSKDSRRFGCVPVEKIESKVWIRFWPLSKFGKV